MTNHNVDNPIVLGFDMDGVLIDHTKSKIRLARQFGFDILPEQTSAEILRKQLPIGTYQKLQELLYDDPVISLRSPAMKGIRTVLALIKKRGLPYYLISRRRHPDHAIALLTRHGLWPQYFNDSNSWFVGEPKDKDIKAVELGVTHYIDDEPKIINQLTGVPNRFLFDPLDVFASADHYQKISSWSEFKRVLNSK